MLAVHLLAAAPLTAWAEVPTDTAADGELDLEAIRDRLLDHDLSLKERLARSQYAKAEELLRSVEQSYAGGHPATPNRDRRRAIKVRQLLLKLHRQHQPDAAEVIESDCFAIAWMSAAVGDHQVALDHLECYLQTITSRLGASSNKALEARSLHAEALGMVDRLAEAEQEHQQAISGLKRLAGPPSRELASALRSFAGLLDRLARFDEYESVLREYIATVEVVAGNGSEDHYFAVGALINFLSQWGRAEEADALTWQAYTALGASPAKDGFMMAIASWRAGGAALRARQPEEALQLYQLAYDLHERHMGPEYLHLGSIKVSIAQAQKAAGHSALARLSLQQAIEFFDGDSARSNSDFAALAHLELARLLVDGGAAGDALRSVDRAEAVLSRLHGGCSQQQMDTTLVRLQALEYLKQPTPPDTLRSALHCASRLVSSAQSLRIDALDARQRLRPFLEHFIRHAMAQGGGSEDLFEALQLANVSETSATVVRLTGAALAASPELADLLRRREDLVEQLRKLDRLEVQPEGRLERDATLKARQQRPALEAALDDLDHRLKSHPQLGANAGRDLPVSTQDIARVLRRNEGIVVFHFDSSQGVAWVSSKACNAAQPIDATVASLAQRVAHIRRGLELRDGQPVEFDVGAAHALYRTLFGPIERCLAGVDHLVVVTPGPLGALPVGVLPLTAGEPDRKAPVKWLLQRYSVSLVPSVATLVAMRPRGAASPRNWPLPFFGVGDPVLPASTQQTQGSLASLRELPHTSIELTRMASTLGASRADLLLRGEASAESLAQLDLSRYQVIAFATHGLSPAEVRDRGEPALVLSPSRNRSSLLLASDVAKLNLTADLVILSACNTAAADGGLRGEWLSGLTRAFFRAGARSVMASHWYVSSAGTTALTTRALEHYRRSRAPTGKSQALRLAALELIESADPLLSHPVVWGAFSLVGDGAAEMR